VGIDGKYGRVTLERGSIGEDEPVVVFRAQDRFLPEVLRFYRALCAGAGSPDHHLAMIQSNETRVRDWQCGNHTQTPHSAGLLPVQPTDPGDLPSA
jgi:hypothetical protein